MLVLSRKENEAVRIGDNVVVRVVSVKGQRVRLAFDAPDDVKILRTEVAVWDGPNDVEIDQASVSSASERRGEDHANGLRIVDFLRQRRKDSQARTPSHSVNMG